MLQVSSLNILGGVANYELKLCAFKIKTPHKKCMQTLNFEGLYLEKYWIFLIL